MLRNLKNFPYSLKDVETDINKRWELGTPHHPKSEAFFDAIRLLDSEFCNNYFDWRKGGDGDNGETLMYLLDIYFEAEEKHA